MFRSYFSRAQKFFQYWYMRHVTCQKHQLSERRNQVSEAFLKIHSRFAASLLKSGFDKNCFLILFRIFLLRFALLASSCSSNFRKNNEDKLLVILLARIIDEKNCIILKKWIKIVNLLIKIRLSFPKKYISFKIFEAFIVVDF